MVEPRCSGRTFFSQLNHPFNMAINPTPSGLGSPRTEADDKLKGEEVIPGRTRQGGSNPLFFLKDKEVTPPR